MHYVPYEIEDRLDLPICEKCPNLDLIVDEEHKETYGGYAIDIS